MMNSKHFLPKMIVVALFLLLASGCGQAAIPAPDMHTVQMVSYRDSFLGFAVEYLASWEVAPLPAEHLWAQPAAGVEFHSDLYMRGEQAFGRYYVNVAVVEAHGTLTETVTQSLAPVAPEVRDRITQHCCLTVGGEPAMELKGVPWGRWGCRQIVTVHGGRAYWLTFAPFNAEATTPSRFAARTAFEAFLRSFTFVPATTPPTTAITPVPTPAQVSPRVTATRAASPSTPAPTPGRPDVIIQVGEKSSGTIRPLLGVNIGPAPAGKPGNADLTDAYRQIGVTLIRTHDFYGPLDMAVMYPNRLQDPAEQRSYDFRTSDAMWRAIVQGGFEPYLRLGDSWNNARPPANAQELANWARAAVEVVRHYRQGKWNGFTTAFRYVEIWNEPDLAQFWPRPHTPREYFQLYVETARALKQAFPDLRIGGPGLTQAGVMTPQGKKWLHDFLLYVKQNNAALDFLSWHMYSNNPADWANAAQFYRGELDALGLSATALHVTEWNTDIRPVGDKSAEALALRTGGKGAAILTAAWIALQENQVEAAAFYRGPDPDLNAPEFYGLFYADGRPKRAALAFSLWARMAAHPQRLKLTTTPQTALWALAGQDAAGETALLLANPYDEAIRYAVTGAPARQLALRQVSDADETVRAWTADGNVAEIGGHTVQLVTVIR